MAKTITINIVSAEKSIYSGDVEMVFAPGSDGELGITPNHSPLLTTLKSGEVRLKTEDEEFSFFINGGLMEVQPKVVTVLSDTAIRAQDLDEAKAIEAKENAQRVINAHEDDVSYAEAMAELQQAMAQIQAISRLRKASKK